jgi:hypothetical protein
MAAGHGTTATIGGCVIAAGSFPGGYGVYQVVGSGQSPWSNVWFDIGVVFWVVGVALVVGAGVHFFVEWRRGRKNPVKSPPPSPTQHVTIIINMPSGKTGDFIVPVGEQKEVPVRENEPDGR